MLIILQTTGTIYRSTIEFWPTFGGPIATLIGVLVSAAIAIILFTKQFKRERLLIDERRDKEKKDILIKEQQELNYIKDLFTTLLVNVIENSEKQATHYKEYANKTIENPYLLHYPISVTHENLKRLLDIDIKLLLKLFKEYKLNEELYIKVLTNLDYLNEVFIRTTDDIYERNGKVLIDLSNRLIKNRNMALKVATEYLNDQKQKNEDYRNDELWNLINLLVHNYYVDNDGIPNVEWDFNKFIIPIKDNLLKEEYRNIDICNQLLNFSKDAGDIVFSFKQYNEQLAKDVLQVCEYIKESCNDLDKIKNKFE